MTASTVTVTESRESTFILLSHFRLHHHCHDHYHDQYHDHRHDDDEQPPGVERQTTPSSGQPSCKSLCTGSQRRFLENYDHDDDHDGNYARAHDMDMTHPVGPTSDSWDQIGLLDFGDSSSKNISVTWPLGTAWSQPAQPEDDRPLVLLHHLLHHQHHTDIL